MDALFNSIFDNLFDLVPYQRCILGTIGCVCYRNIYIVSGVDKGWDVGEVLSCVA